MHNGVPDEAGSGGEFHLSGRGIAVNDVHIRSRVADAASYDPADRYVLFELRPAEARCNGYGDVKLPATMRWSVAL